MEPGLPSRKHHDTSHLNGHVYSDDGSAARDMQGGGVRNWLLPMLSDAAVEINIAKAAQSYASQASDSASEAAMGQSGQRLRCGN